jgi:hypothetical protein
MKRLAFCFSLVSNNRCSTTCWTNTKRQNSKANQL